jgi:hypothetical protein
MFVEISFQQLVAITSLTEVVSTTELNSPLNYVANQRAVNLLTSSFRVDAFTLVLVTHPLGESGSGAECVCVVMCIFNYITDLIYTLIG